jgi:hypothetical protein
MAVLSPSASMGTFGTYYVQRDPIASRPPSQLYNVFLRVSDGSPVLLLLFSFAFGPL